MAWLAADEREGRGIGTAGIEAAASYTEQRFAFGLEPAGVEGSFRQELAVMVVVTAEEESGLVSMVTGSPSPGPISPPRLLACASYRRRTGGLRRARVSAPSWGTTTTRD